MNPNPVPIGGSNPPKPALSGGGGGSTFDPMEARVARLESLQPEAELFGRRRDCAVGAWGEGILRIEEHGELIGAQGKKVDIGGYYLPDDAKAGAAMRPSATLNAALAAV